jgi:hypothetical protein
LPFLAVIGMSGDQLDPDAVEAVKAELSAL